MSQIASDEAHIRQVIEKRSQAAHDKDVDLMTSAYDPDALLYDVLAPLMHKGGGIKENTEAWFSGYKTPIGYDISDLSVTVGGGVAFASYLYFVTGTRTDDTEVEMRVRATVGWQKKDGKWLIVHEHQSAPYDPESGQALINLFPE